MNEPTFPKEKQIHQVFWIKYKYHAKEYERVNYINTKFDIGASLVLEQKKMRFTNCDFNKTGISPLTQQDLCLSKR